MKSSHVKRFPWRTCTHLCKQHAGCASNQNRQATQKHAYAVVGSNCKQTYTQHGCMRAAPHGQTHTFVPHRNCCCKPQRKIGVNSEENYTNSSCANTDVSLAQTIRDFIPQDMHQLSFTFKCILVTCHTEVMAQARGADSTKLDSTKLPKAECVCARAQRTALKGPRSKDSRGASPFHTRSCHSSQHIGRFISPSTHALHKVAHTHTQAGCLHTRVPLRQRK